MTIAGTLLMAGLALSQTGRDSDPEDATAGLKKLHAGLHRDQDGFVTAVRLHPQGGRIDDALPHLRRLPRLASIAFHTDNLTADGFLALAKLPVTDLELVAPEASAGPGRGFAPPPVLSWDKLPRVRTVRLTGKGIEDAQLRDVAAGTAQHLFLSGVGVTAKGLEHLRESKTLTLVCVQSSAVTADGVKALVGMGNLKSLTLTATTLERDGFRLLAGMTGLEYLSLESTKMTDADAAHLAGLANLTTLDLGYNPDLTDAALKHLAGLPKLAALRLFKTKVTDAAVGELQAVLHELKVGK